MRTLAKRFNHRFFQRSQTGQILIIAALTMIALLIFVGLVTDVGLLLVRFSQLKRAVDSASIAAAGQIRENRDYADVALSARQYIRLHGLDPDRVIVETCVTTPGDPDLCVTPPRKLVRVIAQIDAPTTFLRLIGWGSITLEASSVAETAVLDVALVLDTSESMSLPTNEGAYTGAPPNGASMNLGDIRAECLNNWNWGGCCNDPGNGDVDLDGIISGVTNGAGDGDFSDLVCQPFKQVRDAARTFVQRLDFVRGDRVAFVTFDTTGRLWYPDNPSPPPVQAPPLITSEALAIDTLDEKIGVRINPLGEHSQCQHEPGSLAWTYDWLVTCPDTNMGDGLLRANNILTDATYVRREAVWVIIMLSDGAANRTSRVVNSGVQVPDYTYGWHGYCPWYTFCDPADGYPECTESEAGEPVRSPPFCADNDPYTRHRCITDADDDPLPRGTIDTAATDCDINYYDAADFTMDMADFAGLANVAEGVPGNFIAMYAIGFGTPTEPIPAVGEYLLRYIADAGDNGIIDNNLQTDCRRNGGMCPHDGGSGTVGGLPYDPFNYPAESPYGPPDDCELEIPGNQEDCGQYWYAESLADLERVFAEIASRLFTRLSR